jgi:hypothetical protein
MSRLVRALLAALLLLSTAAWADAPTMYVFLQSTIKPGALEKALREAMPGVEVTVYGRVADFKNALETKPPDAALALRPVLEEFSLKPELQGFAGGTDSEAYVVVSVEAGLTREALATKVVGTVDLVGRSRLAAFVTGVLGLPSAPKIQTVTKVEDLLPLLQFKAADAVLVPQSAVESLLTRSRMDLQVLKLDGARVGLPAVAFSNPARRAELEKAVTAFPKSINDKVGVESWKKK